MAEKKQLNMYRTCTPVVDARYERESNQTILEIIVDALAEAKGVDVTALPPLYDSIETEALARLFESHDENGESETIVSFTLENWNVFVRGDGRIRVCDGTKHSDPRQVFDESAI